ncbi:MAG: hypothetical protein RQ745_02180 [Longimicrobiales bacterium]|nr:hypothetical protein [Longimicrobiales bacterium]
MAHLHIPDSIPARFVSRTRASSTLFGAMALIGAVAFFMQLGNNAQAAWVSYVSNWLFFTSVAMGAIIFAAVTTIVRAKWNWSLRRVSLAGVAFLPISFLLLLPMLGLREVYFPWIEQLTHDPLVQAKAAYLNTTFLVVRNLAGPLLLFGLSIHFAFLALRPDMGRLDEEELDEGQRRWRDRLMAGWSDQDAEELHSRNRMARLSPALVIVYAAVMSFLVYDWAMTLEPHWFSTLFGGWFFMGALWGGIAFTALGGVWLRGRDDFAWKAIGVQQRHDVGKLAFGFTVFWTYLFWSQYIVIWYGKLPWEQIYMVKRAGHGWGSFSLLVIVTCFVIPFAGLIGRAPKFSPKWLGLMMVTILFGLWSERYWLIAPTLQTGGYDVTNMLYQVGIGVGFLGLFLASIQWFFATFPIIQIWQPPQFEETHDTEVAHPA